MQYYHITKRLSAFAGLIFLLLVVDQVNSDRQGTARRIGDNNQRGGFKSNCGDPRQVSARIGRCLDGVFELVEGRAKSPTGDADIQVACETFTNTEKCVRNVAKECLTGLHKTAINSISSSIKKFRLQECRTPASRGRYIEPFKCSIKHSPEIVALTRQHTAITQGIRDLQIAPEEKLVKVCCMLANIDKNIETKFNGFCPSSTPVSLGLTRAITDEVRALLCRTAKCNGALDSVMRTPLKEKNQNLIEPAVEILFLIRTD